MHSNYVLVFLGKEATEEREISRDKGTEREAVMKRQPMKRAMESSKGRGEIRRINVVYFLSRNGNVEQPHLIRVHHFHRNGLHLRDVKRWLSEVRGKDMPESFSWSYKRRYKSGYVWQDLGDDDDLITPISDNEYVLNGSEILPKNDRPLSFCAFSCESAVEPEAKQSPPLKTPPETLQMEPDDTVSPKPPPRLDQESPVPPPRSDESGKRTAVFKIDIRRQQQMKTREERKQQPASSLDNANKHHQDSSSSRGWGAARALRNLLGCGAADNKDSVVQPINRHEKDGVISRDLSVGGSHRRKSFSSARTNQRHHQSFDPNNARRSWSGGGRSSTTTGQRAIPAAYKPVAEPNCSQCGKAFRPEKLHSHMKTCKALRARVKNSDVEKQPLKDEMEELSMESSQSFSSTR